MLKAENRRLGVVRLSPAQILVFGYSSVILLGSLLLSLPIAVRAGNHLNYVDALFTATSATAVTGLVVVDTGSFFSPFGQLVILVMIQLGGLGLMTVGTVVTMMLGRKIGLRHRIMIQEDLGYLTLSGLVRTALVITRMALLIEAIGALLLWLRWRLDLGSFKAIYYAIFHSISAFCNAGFDLFGNSLEGYAGDIVVNIVISSLFIIGGLGFVVLLEIATLKPRRFSFHTKLVLTTTSILILAGFIFVLASEYSNPLTLGGLDLKGKILGAYFQGVTPRTAGFDTIKTGNFRPVTLFFMLILMFIGASPGSTGGGIKTTTAAVMAASLLSTITGEEDPNIFRRRFSIEVIRRAMAVGMLAFLLVVASSLVLLSVEPFEPYRVIFETVSAFGTVGLSTGITGSLTTLGRIVILLTMFAGRVGPMTLAIAVGHKRQPPSFRYPEGKIMVG